jgi:hypothetical protein
MRISILLCTRRTNRILCVESKSTPSHRSQTQRRMGHPQELRLNFEVTYLSGIILTKAPSIVETTDTKRTRVGHPPSTNCNQ